MIQELRREKTTNEPAILTLVHPNLETRLGSVPAVPKKQQSSTEPGQKTDVLDRLAKAPLRRTIHLRRRLRTVNLTVDTTIGTTRSETTSTSRGERRPDRSSLTWSRPIASPWHVYKQDLINGLLMIVGVDWMIAAGINLAS